MNQQLTLKDNHLKYDIWFQQVYWDYLFAESESDTLIIVHTLSGNFQCSVTDIEYTIQQTQKQNTGKG